MLPLVSASPATLPKKNTSRLGKRPAAAKAGRPLSGFAKQRSSAAGEKSFIASVRRQAFVPAKTRLSQATPGARVVTIRPQSVELRLGIGDDCAILRPRPRHEIVVTTDLFLEQVHFRRDWHTPEAAGHRCLARGLSDLAAMGAEPMAAFLSLALPPELAGAWAQRFLAGLLSLARRHHVPLAGGDTAQAPAIAAVKKQRVNDSSKDQSVSALFTADIVLLGSVKQGGALLRAGARPGDAIYVTGFLGGAAAELALLEASPERFLDKRKARKGHPHLFPEPRLRVGQRVRTLATAAIDISDGLSTDLIHLCEESGVSAELTTVPVHPLARQAGTAEHALQLALHGGEDYELLFTAPAKARVPAHVDRIPIHRIGEIVARRRGRPRLTLLDARGKRIAIAAKGWEHFRNTPQA